MHILVVENVAPTARWLDAVLTAAGHQVLLQADVGAAVGILAGGQFDVVVVESLLPGTRGEDVIERLRALGTPTKAILLFPLVGTAPRLPAGALALERPFSRQRLVDAIQHLAGGAPAPGSSTPRILPPELPEAMLHLARRSASGVLRVTHEDSERRVTLRGGAPTFVRADYSSDNFGRFLVRRGVIREEVLEHSHAHMVSKGVPQGEALIRLGVLQQAQLYALLKAFQRERLLTMFTWPGPTLEFIEDVEPAAGEPVYAIDPIPLVFEGYQRFGNTDALFHWPEEHGDRFVRRCDAFAQYFSLLQSQWPKLPLGALTQGQQPLHMILRSVPVDVIFAVRTLRALLSLDMIALVEAPVSGGDASTEPVLDPSQILGEFNLDLGRSDFEVDLAAPIDPRLNRVFEVYLSLQFASHYELLGVPADASAAGIDAAFEAQRASYEELLAGLPDAPEAVAKVQEILLHLQLARAVLSQAAARARYDQQLLERTNATVQRRASLGAEARFKSGLSALKAGRYQVARIEFEAARALRADDALCNLYALWATYLQQRDAVQKVGTLRANLAEQARLLGDAQGYAFHAWICLDLGFADNARQAAAQALTIDEHNPEAAAVWRAIEEREAAG